MCEVSLLTNYVLKFLLLSPTTLYNRSICYSRRMHYPSTLVGF